MTLSARDRREIRAVLRGDSSDPTIASIVKAIEGARVLTVANIRDRLNREARRLQEREWPPAVVKPHRDAAGLPDLVAGVIDEWSRWSSRSS